MSANCRPISAVWSHANLSSAWRRFLLWKSRYRCRPGHTKVLPLRTFLLVILLNGDKLNFTQNKVTKKINKASVILDISLSVHKTNMELSSPRFLQVLGASALDLSGFIHSALASPGQQAPSYWRPCRLSYRHPLCHPQLPTAQQAFESKTLQVWV